MYLLLRRQQKMLRSFCNTTVKDLNWQHPPACCLHHSHERSCLVTVRTCVTNIMKGKLALYLTRILAMGEQLLWLCELE